METVDRPKGRANRDARTVIRRFWSAAIAVTVMMISAGCGLTINPDARPLTGDWIGTYTCSQGLTGITLNMTGHANGAVDAIFSFYAIPENPNVPSGITRTRGAYQIGGGLNLDAVSWIKQPLFYGLVDLVGSVSPDLTTYSGAVEGSACTTFQVTRQ